MYIKLYNQYILTQTDENSKTYVLSWLPSHAEIGNLVTLKDPITKEIKPGYWEITQKFKTQRTEKQIKEHIRIARQYRKYTDI